MEELNGSTFDHGDDDFNSLNSPLPPLSSMLDGSTTPPMSPLLEAEIEPVHVHVHVHAEDVMSQKPLVGSNTVKERPQIVTSRRQTQILSEVASPPRPVVSPDFHGVSSLNAASEEGYPAGKEKTLLPREESQKVSSPSPERAREPHDVAAHETHGNLRTSRDELLSDSKKPKKPKAASRRGGSRTVEDILEEARLAAAAQKKKKKEDEDVSRNDAAYRKHIREEEEEARASEAASGASMASKASAEEDWIMVDAMEATAGAAADVSPPHVVEQDDPPSTPPSTSMGMSYGAGDLGPPVFGGRSPPRMTSPILKRLAAGEERRREAEEMKTKKEVTNEVGGSNEPVEAELMSEAEEALDTAMRVTSTQYTPVSTPLKMPSTPGHDAGSILSAGRREVVFDGNGSPSSSPIRSSPPPPETQMTTTTTASPIKVKGVGHSPILNRLKEAASSNAAVLADFEEKTSSQAKALQDKREARASSFNERMAKMRASFGLKETEEGGQEGVSASGPDGRGISPPQSRPQLGFGPGRG